MPSKKRSRSSVFTQTNGLPDFKHKDVCQQVSSHLNTTQKRKADTTGGISRQDTLVTLC